MSRGAETLAACGFACFFFHLVLLYQVQELCLSSFKVGKDKPLHQDHVRGDIKMRTRF